MSAGKIIQQVPERIAVIRGCQQPNQAHLVKAYLSSMIWKFGGTLTLTHFTEQQQLRTALSFCLESLHGFPLELHFSCTPSHHSGHSHPSRACGLNMIGLITSCAKLACLYNFHTLLILFQFLSSIFVIRCASLMQLFIFSFPWNLKYTKLCPNL